MALAWGVSLTKVWHGFLGAYMACSVTYHRSHRLSPLKKSRWFLNDYISRGQVSSTFLETSAIIFSISFATLQVQSQTHLCASMEKNMCGYLNGFGLSRVYF